MSPENQTTPEAITPAAVRVRKRMQERLARRKAYETPYSHRVFSLFDLGSVDRFCLEAIAHNKTRDLASSHTAVLPECVPDTARLAAALEALRRVGAVFRAEGRVTLSLQEGSLGLEVSCDVSQEAALVEYLETHRLTLRDLAEDVFTSAGLTMDGEDSQP
jgi:hypothetical protein